MDLLPTSRWAAALLVLALCGPALADSTSRTWTDSQGRTLQGKFVRIVGGSLVLQLPSGKILQVAVADLSLADRQYLEQFLAGEGFRTWTDAQGRQVHAKYLRVYDGNVFVELDGKTVSFPFATLSKADRRFVRTAALEKKQVDQLPAADDSEKLPEMRTWTDVDGHAAQAALDSVLTDGRVLLAADDATRIVPMNKLSAADHDYLRPLLESQGAAHLVPPRPAPPVAAVAAAPPPPSVPFVLPSSSALAPPVANVPPPQSRPNYYNQARIEEPRETNAIQQPTTPNPSMKYHSKFLKCNTCGAPAPPGWYEGDACPYCKKRATNYPLLFGGGTGGLGALGLIAYLLGRFLRGVRS